MGYLASIPLLAIIVMIPSALIMGIISGLLHVQVPENTISIIMFEVLLIVLFIIETINKKGNIQNG